MWIRAKSQPHQALWTSVRAGLQCWQRAALTARGSSNLMAARASLSPLRGRFGTDPRCYSHLKTLSLGREARSNSELAARSPLLCTRPSFFGSGVGVRTRSWRCLSFSNCYASVEDASSCLRSIPDHRSSKSRPNRSLYACCVALQTRCL